jgi:glycosyltransferase involved in cell wall biosynthesis
VCRLPRGLSFAYTVVMAHAKLSGAVSVWSNSYNAPTGYGQQVKHLVDYLKKDGLDVAMLSNYGLEGIPSKIKTPHGEVPHFPRGLDTYSNDVAPQDHMAWAAKHPELKSLMITLYDVWVLRSPLFDRIPQIASWVPLDHVTLPPKVKEWLEKPNVTPIAMAPHGAAQLRDAGIDCEYAPHAVDIRKMKPTENMPNGMHVRDFMQSRDKFVVGMVAANKSSGLVHRKAFSENLLAFSLFHKKHPDSMMYIHTEPMGAGIGWNLVELIKGCGIPQEAVAFPNPQDYRHGMSQDALAALYTGMDVFLAPSYGEGFGVPTVEAQACGTPAIASSWAASKDLISDDGWLIEGQPQWDSSQNAWWQIPQVPSIVKALELAYERGRDRSEASIKFAKQFDVPVVWRDHWRPILEKML